MKKKIALLTIIAFVLTSVCLYAAPRGVSQARQKQKQLEERIDTLEDILRAMKKRGLATTELYKETEKTVKDLKKQYNALEEAVDELCGSDWDKDVSLPASLVRKIDSVCNAYDALHPKVSDYE